MVAGAPGFGEGAVSRRSVPGTGTVSVMNEEPKSQSEPAPETLATLVPAPGSSLPRTRELYLALYAAIVDGRLPAGAVLPPSRALAATLGVARNTVVAVYAQLSDESLVEGVGRRGTRVLDPFGRAGAGEVPASRGASGRARSRPIAQARADRGACPTAERRPARRSADCLPAGAPTTASGGVPGARDFAPGEPDATLFPARLWTRALARAGTLPAASLGYRTNAAPGVRESIAHWLATRRSLVVDPGRIVVTSGTRQSLALAGLLCAEAGDVALVESPGYRGAAEAFGALGLEVRAGTVDADGLVPPAPDDAPRLAYVTPCFQYPSGVPLSAERRAALLELSATRGTVVFEDDYDSEFRDARQPRPALAAEADAAGAAVLHAGTFSKLLFPAARVGWLVVPPGWSARAEACLRVLGGGHGQVLQHAVAALLDDGSVARHLRRARAVYLRRREVLDGSLAGCAALRSVGAVGRGAGRDRRPGRTGAARAAGGGADGGRPGRAAARTAADRGRAGRDVPLARARARRRRRAVRAGAAGGAGRRGGGAARRRARRRRAYDSGTGAGGARRRSSARPERHAATSLKSVHRPGTQPAQNLGSSSRAPAASAARVALVRPGLPGTPRSSSPNTISATRGQRPAKPRTTASRFDASNATSVGWPVSACTLAPVASPSTTAAEAVPENVPMGKKVPAAGAPGA